MLYLQRFYMVHPFQDHLCELVACAAVQLAAKAEEVAVKTPSVVDALLSMYPGVFVSPITTEAPQTRSECLRRGVIEKEHILLLTLSFDVAVHLPFGWVTRTVHSLAQKHPAWMHGSLSRASDPSARVSAAALSLLTDAFFTECCVTMSPKEMAVCAVALAAKIVTGAKMPALFLEQHATSSLCGTFAKTIMDTAARAAASPAMEAAAAAAGPDPHSVAHATSAAASEAAVKPGISAAADGSEAKASANAGLPPPLDIFG